MNARVHHLPKWFLYEEKVEISYAPNRPFFHVTIWFKDKKFTGIGNNIAEAAKHARALRANR